MVLVHCILTAETPDVVSVVIKKVFDGSGVGTLYRNSRNTGCCVRGSQEVVLVCCILTAETLDVVSVAVSRWCWYIVS